MSDMEKYPGVVEFLFNAPLYQDYFMDMKQALGLFSHSINIDGHCPHCGKVSTFHRTKGQIGWNPPEEGLKRGLFNYGLVITCARSDRHNITFDLILTKLTDENVHFELSKMGQYPSLADIAIDESKQYSAVLSKEDGRELHKAIGLAAHGVGIGSFVYLRRVFERL